MTLDYFWYIFKDAIIWGGLFGIGTILMLNFLKGFETPSEKAEKRWAARHANDPIATVPGEFVIIPNIKRGDGSGYIGEARTPASGYRPEHGSNEWYRSDEYAELHPHKSGAWVFRGDEPNPAESDAVDLPTAEQWDAFILANRRHDDKESQYWKEMEWDADGNYRRAHFGADRPNPETPEPDEGGPVDFDWLKNWREGK